jgi:hypothetical protein
MSDPSRGGARLRQDNHPDGARRPVSRGRTCRGSSPSPTLRRSPGRIFSARPQWHRLRSGPEAHRWFACPERWECEPKIRSTRVPVHFLSPFRPHVEQGAEDDVGQRFRFAREYAMRILPRIDVHRHLRGGGQGALSISRASAGAQVFPDR